MAHHFMDPQLDSVLSSLNTHTLTLEEVYDNLDQEILQLQRRLSALQTFRNSLSPISKFPTELLSKIFSDTQEFGDLPLTNDIDLKTRFSLSWVCRRWRSTALATPNLWTIISMENRDAPVSFDFSQELLVRSRNCHLTINFVQPTSDLLDAFIPQMHRIKHIRVSKLRTYDTPEFDIFLSQAAPVLVSLEFASVDIDRTSPMFLGEHPRLQSLVVADLWLLTPSSLITSLLTRLHIRSFHDCFPVNYLIDILPSLHDLAELVLDVSLDDINTPHPNERIRLPRLQSLIITDDFSRLVFDFLRCLDIPQTPITLIWPEGAGWSNEAKEEFYQGFDEYQQVAPIPISHLKVEREYPDKVIIDMSSTLSQHCYSFQFPAQQFGSDDTERFVSHLSLQNLKTLSTNELSRRMLGTLKCVTTLSHMTLSRVMTVEDFIHLSNSNPLNIGFPALKRLTVCRVEGVELEGLRKCLVSHLKVKIGLEIVFEV